MTKLVTAFAAVLVLAATAALAQDKAEKKAPQVAIHQITDQIKILGVMLLQKLKQFPHLRMAATQVHIRNPDRVALTIEGCRFDRPGLYGLELFCDNTWVCDTQLLLR